MPAIQRLGDKNTGGGAVIKISQSSVSANNILVSVNGSAVSSHGKSPHKQALTANGSNTVSINGIPVNRVGDPDTCRHTRVGGASSVSVN